MTLTRLDGGMGGGSNDDGGGASGGASVCARVRMLRVFVFVLVVD